MSDELAVEGGFADPVFAAQATFRALMDALARPGTRHAIGGANPPPPLAPELAAVMLTLCDHDTSVWFDPLLANSPAVVAWLAFHCGAPLTSDPALAQFAFISDAGSLPALSAFGQGTDEYPDRSTTLVVAATGPERRCCLAGPGIDGERIVSLALPGGDIDQWAANKGRFPRGVDLILCAGGGLVGLPRTTRIAEAG